MASSLSQPQEELHVERLLWIERRPINANDGADGSKNDDGDNEDASSSCWWPAYRYDNYGHALKALSSSSSLSAAAVLDGRLKSRWTLLFLRQPTRPVVRLLGTMTLVPLSSQQSENGNDNEEHVNTRDFLQYIQYAADTRPELRAAMKELDHLMVQDDRCGQQQPGGTTTAGADAVDDRSGTTVTTTTMPTSSSMTPSRDANSHNEQQQQHRMQPAAKQTTATAETNVSTAAAAAAIKSTGTSTGTCRNNNIIIDRNDSWQHVWTKLRTMGWKYRMSKSGNSQYWVMPGASIRRGIHGRDYFRTLSQVQAYVSQHHGWTNGNGGGSGNDGGMLRPGQEEERRHNVDSSVVATLTTATTNHTFSKRRRQQAQPPRGAQTASHQHKKRRTSATGNKNKDKDTGRVWGRAPPPSKTQVFSTPPDQATKPQDPSKPLLSSSESSSSRRSDQSSSSNDDQYTCWKVLWDKLKHEGWIAVKATRYNVLHDWYYVRPTCSSVATGKLGKDYFATEEDVMMFCQAQRRRRHDNDNNDNNDTPSSSSSSSSPSVMIMTSPRKASRNHRRTAADAAIPPPPPAVKKPKKSWWFHDEPLPSFRHVWAILHHKLDFRYTNGCYKLPLGTAAVVEQGNNGNLFFSTDHDMRRHLVQHGIPYLHKVSPEERAVLERWVTFCHVPVKDTNSTGKLYDMQELSKEEASYMLVHCLGFVKDANGRYVRGMQVFASLQEARDYFRSASSLEAPQLHQEGGGRRRRSRESSSSSMAAANGVVMSDDQVLRFRLWAALSSTPLPTVEVLSSSSSSSSPLTAKQQQNRRAAVSGKQGEDEETAAVKKKDNNVVVFEFQHDDDDDTALSGNHRRITMSPSKAVSSMQVHDDDSCSY